MLTKALDETREIYNFETDILCPISGSTKNEEFVIEGDGTNLSHIEENLVIEMNIVELATRDSQKYDEDNY